MKNLRIKFKLFSLPVMAITLLIAILGTAIWYFMYIILKIEHPDRIDLMVWVIPILTGIAVYFAFRKKWKILESWTSNPDYEPKYFIYASTIITTTFLAAGSIGFFKQETKVLSTLDCISDLQELGKSQNCQLKKFYIDKPNFGIDELNTTYTQNNSFSSEDFVTTIVCPIYCDTLESEKIAAAPYWFVIRHYERFKDALPLLEKDSIFKAKTLQYITELIEDTIRFEYIEYFPYSKPAVDLDLDRCLLAASKSDKFSNPEIRGFVFPRDLKFFDKKSGEQWNMFGVIAILWCVTILLPLVLKINLNEYNKYKNQ